MPRKPNYSFERRQRELAKAEKKAARREARAKRKEQQTAEAQAGDGAPETEETPAPE